MTADIGPLLAEVLDAQRCDEAATAFPQLEAYCAALDDVCEMLGSPLVWPVSPAAERLAGAAVLFSQGRIRLREWSSRIDGDRVLLLAVAAATPIPLISAAKHARAIGATEVRACGIAIGRMDASDEQRHLGGYIELKAPAPIYV
jgi:hypothetical protein